MKKWNAIVSINVFHVGTLSILGDVVVVLFKNSLDEELQHEPLVKEKHTTDLELNI